MAKRGQKSVLFLCTGNFYRSRFAEVLFGSVAGKLGLPWTATSRGLAPDCVTRNVGPMAPSAVAALQALGVRAAAECSRLPVPVTLADLEAADRVIALKRDEHLLMLEEYFPAWVEKVEFWHVDDAPGALPLIERAVMDLTARLLGGSPAREAPAPEPAAPPPEPVKRPVTVRVGRETKGRRGKGVTVVSDLPLDEAALQELAGRLKQKCGTGGTVKDGRIEIQGDQRDRLAAELEKLGYRVKRAGG
jgi:predicted translation initiation factor SUI1